MNKRTLSLLTLIMLSAPSFSQEQKLPEAPELHRSHHHRHISIHIPEQQHSPHTPNDIKKLKIKVAALATIVTALITGGITLYIALRNCN